MKKVGDTMAFTGGAEDTPVVIVGACDSSHGPMHMGDKVLIITQDKVKVVISPQTLESILAWYYSER